MKRREYKVVASKLRDDACCMCKSTKVIGHLLDHDYHTKARLIAFVNSLNASASPCFIYEIQEMK